MTEAALPRLAVVTGSDSGIGQATAQLLATEGFDASWFHVSAKTGANVEALFRALGGTIAQGALGK